MKNIFTLGLSLLLSISMLAGCSDKKKDPPAETTKIKAQDPNPPSPPIP